MSVPSSFGGKEIPNFGGAPSESLIDGSPKFSIFEKCTKCGTETFTVEFQHGPVAKELDLAHIDDRFIIKEWMIVVCDRCKHKSVRRALDAKDPVK